MSKAFTKEDTSNENDEPEFKAPSIPAGGKNYMTPAGFKRMQQEMHNLRTKIRPEITQTVAWAAANGDRSENADYQYGKRRLREIDRRLEFLTKRLESAHVVDPLAVACDHVKFGATVTIADEDGNERTYTIVGIDEIDLSKGRISWASPIANALMRAKVGDSITFQAPKGKQELEVLAIHYLEIP